MASLELKRRDLIPVQTGSAWQIESGLARTIVWDNVGNAIALGFWRPGDVITRDFIHVRPYRVECLTTTQLQELPSHWRYSPDELLAYLRQTEELLKITRSKGMEVRLLNFLHWFAQQYGCYTAPKYRGISQLTHQDIADAIGSTRVTITRLINKLQREGLLDFS